jgi:hypothetical protein
MVETIPTIQSPILRTTPRANTPEECRAFFYFPVPVLLREWVLTTEDGEKWVTE